MKKRGSEESLSCPRVQPGLQHPVKSQHLGEGREWNTLEGPGQAFLGLPRVCLGKPLALSQEGGHTVVPQTPDSVFSQELALFCLGEPESRAPPRALAQAAPVPLPSPVFVDPQKDLGPHGITVLKCCLTPVHLLYLIPLPLPTGMSEARGQLGRMQGLYHSPPAPCRIPGLFMVPSSTEHLLLGARQRLTTLASGTLGSPPWHREGQGSRPHLDGWPGWVPEISLGASDAHRGRRAPWCCCSPGVS